MCEVFFIERRINCRGSSRFHLLCLSTGKQRARLTLRYLHSKVLAISLSVSWGGLWSSFTWFQSADQHIESTALSSANKIEQSSAFKCKPPLCFDAGNPNTTATVVFATESILSEQLRRCRLTSWSSLVVHFYPFKYTLAGEDSFILGCLGFWPYHSSTSKSSSGGFKRVCPHERK